MTYITNTLQQNVLCDKSISRSSLTPPIISSTTPVLSLAPPITSSTNHRVTCTNKSKLPSHTPPIASSTPPNRKSNPTTTITSNSNVIPPLIHISLSTINTQTLVDSTSGQAAVVSSTCTNSPTNIHSTLQKTTNKPEITSSLLGNSQSLNITTTIFNTPTTSLTSSNDQSFNSHVTGMDHEAVVHWPDSQSIAPVQSVNDVIDYSRNFPSPGVNSTVLGYGGQRRRIAYASTDEAMMYRDPAVARAFRDTRRPHQM